MRSKLLFGILNANLNSRCEVPYSDVKGPHILSFRQDSPKIRGCYAKGIMINDMVAKRTLLSWSIAMYYGPNLGTDIRYNNYTMKYGIMVYTGIIPWRWWFKHWRYGSFMFLEGKYRIHRSLVALVCLFFMKKSLLN